MSESTPSTFSGVAGTEWDPKKHSRIAYNGLVPMSPYTMPMAVRVRGRSLRWRGRTVDTLLQSAGEVS
jgi:hypothetical protein